MTARIDVTLAIAVIGVTEGPQRGLVHTVGLFPLGERELEIVGVPLFLHPFACGLLNQVCDWRLNHGGVIRERGILHIEPCWFRFVASVGEDHAPRWRLSDDVLSGHCTNPHCGARHEH